MGFLRDNLWQVCELIHQQVVGVNTQISCSNDRWSAVHLRREGEVIKQFRQLDMGGGGNAHTQDERLHFHTDYWIRSFGAPPGIMGEILCVLGH